MKEPIIIKNELLTRLNKIYDQLEKLEAVLHSSFNHQQEYVRSVQDDRVMHCSRRLTTLETELDKQLVEKSGRRQCISSQHIKNRTAIQLEFGLKSM